MTVYRDRDAGLEFDLCEIQFVPDALKEKVPALIELMKVLAVPCCVAGGVLRDPVAEFITHKDIDVFFFDAKDQKTAKENLKKIKGTREYYLDPSEPSPEENVFHAKKWGIVDLVPNVRGTTPQEVISTFDFICCAAALTPEAFFYHREFERDAYARVLRVQDTAVLGDKNRARARRFVNKGWRISEKEMAKLPPETQLRRPYTYGS